MPIIGTQPAMERTHSEGEMTRTRTKKKTSISSYEGNAMPTSMYQVYRIHMCCHADLIFTRDVRRHGAAVQLYTQ